MILQSHFWAYIGTKLYSKRHMHPYIHSSTIYNSQVREAT